MQRAAAAPQVRAARRAVRGRSGARAAPVGEAPAGPTAISRRPDVVAIGCVRSAQRHHEDTGDVEAPGGQAGCEAAVVSDVSDSQWVCLLQRRSLVHVDLFSSSVGEEEVARDVRVTVVEWACVFFPLCLVGLATTL